MNRSFPFIIAACICAVAFLFGIIRIGVGMGLVAQATAIVDVAAFREPVAEVQHFLSEQNDRALIPLSTVSYLAIIALMGLCLVFGAVLSWRRERWGYGLLSVYLLMHAGLFVNFQTINPKIFILFAGVILMVVLIFANRHRRS